jgi:Na+-translocating ferredoxin:NAD+ oxidoreductase RnfC subunit
VGVVVNNVETLVNIAAAAAGQPVTRKTLTIAGAVRRPLTLTLPIGTAFRDAIELAGGLTIPDPVLCVGGLMMGQITLDLEAPITKTTTGVVILPRDHPVMERRLKPAAAQARIGKSACDQCRYCTEFCPRFLLGYAVEPHQVMRSLAFTAAGQSRWNEWAWLCCACGLCTWYACPEMLFPKEACDDSKAELRRANFKWNGPANLRPHPLREGRRVPIKRLARKLQVQDYDAPAPWLDLPYQPKRLVLPLKQSAGVACLPAVQPGDRVREGQVIGRVPAQALGAALHAPMSGVVVAVADGIVLETEL